MDVVFNKRRKYKVGDKVLIKKYEDINTSDTVYPFSDIKNELYFHSDIMDELKNCLCDKIFEVYKSSEDGVMLEVKKDRYLFFSNSMIVRKVNGMTKSDLRSGMIVETREEKRYITIVKEDGNINFMNLDGFHCLDGHSLLDNMTNKINRKYDIMKVYAIPFVLNDCKTTQDLIWEWKEQKEMTIAEIEKELGYSIKIVKED